MADFTTKIADTVSSVGVRSAYGEPLDLDGTTVVPVALTWYGFGAGEGGGEGRNSTKSGDRGSATGEPSRGEGQAGGGGGFAAPLGAYVTREGSTRFEPNTIALLAVGIPFVCVAGRALARVIRALKR